MKILNLDLDDMHLMGRATDLGFEMNLGKKTKYFPNKIFINNEGNRFYEQSDLCGDFNIDTSFNSIVTLNSVKSSDDLSYYNKNYNVLFTGVYSLDCKTIVSDMKILANDDIVEDIKLVALGLMETSKGHKVTRKNFPVAVLLMNKSCDYKIKDTIFSGRTGEIIKESKNKVAYPIEGVILNCMLNSMLE